MKILPDVGIHEIKKIDITGLVCKLQNKSPKNPTFGMHLLDMQTLLILQDYQYWRQKFHENFKAISQRLAIL